MYPIRIAALTLTALLAGVMTSCSTDDHDGNREADALREGRGEHDRDGSEHGREHGGEAGEESGSELGRSEKYDAVRNGVRLVLAYDPATNSFVGTVTNTTAQTLDAVRVEVHLSNGKELGPTTPTDLGPAEVRAVTLAATADAFERWTAHPEVGTGEHGGEGGGEGRGEHGGR